MNPNKKHKLLYQTPQLLKRKKKKELIDDIQIHYIQRLFIGVKNNKRGKSKKLSFNGRQLNGKIVKVVTIKWLYTNFYLRENKFYQSLIYGDSVNHSEVPVRKSHPGSANDTNIIFPTHGQILKFPQGDENSCIIFSLALALYEFGDIYTSKYVYQRFKDVG